MILTFIMVFQAVAGADTTASHVISNAYGGGFPQIKGDYHIWQEFNDGQWHVLLRDGSQTQAMPHRHDPVRYLTDVHGVMLLATPVQNEEDVDAWALMLADKLSQSADVSPFITVGAGITPSNGDAKPGATLPSWGSNNSLSASGSDTKACGKFGTGIGYFPTKNFSLWLEGSYVFGLGDFPFDLSFFGDRETDILRLIFTLGAVYVF